MGRRGRNPRAAGQEITVGVALPGRRGQLSLPVPTMSQGWVRRLSSAIVILGFPKTLGQSPR